jgi:hypothetical protein
VKKQKPVGYMVFYIDEDNGVSMPMGPDPECAGALEGSEEKPLLFKDKGGARRSITISERNARLRQAQEVPANDDFTTGRKKIRIVPVYEFAG